MSIIGGITIANYGSVPLTVTYGNSPVNVAVNTSTAIGYVSGGNIIISDGKNNVTMLQSGIQSIQHVSAIVNVVDSITVGTPVSSSTTSDGPISQELFTHNWALIVSFGDKVVIENLSPDVGLALGVYSNYFSGGGTKIGGSGGGGGSGVTDAAKHYWWVLILIVLVILVAAVGGVYYYKKKKRGGM